MSYAVRRFLNHLPLALGARSDRRLRTTRLKHAQFASFLEDSGFRSQGVDQRERGMRRRRFAKGLVLWGTAFTVAWIALESARAVAIL